MIANDILLDAFTRVHESLHRTLGDIRRRNWLKSRIRRSGGLPGASVESWTPMSPGFPAASSCGSARMGCPVRYAARTGGLWAIGHTRASKSTLPRFRATTPRLSMNA